MQRSRPCPVNRRFAYDEKDKDYLHDRASYRQ